MISPSGHDVAPGRPLTRGERLIWTGQRLDPDVPLYNMAIAWDIQGEVDPVALAQALQRVVDGADALRTVVNVVDGEPTGHVLPDVDVRLDTIAVPVAHRSQEMLQSMMVERTQRLLPMDQPMIDVALYLVGAGRSILYIKQHHLVADAISMGLLYRRLSSEYESALQEQDAPTALPQYASYVEHVRRLHGSEALERATQYWDDGTDPTDPEPTFYGVPGDGSGRTQRVRVSLGEERAVALETLIQRPEFRALTPEHARFLVLSTVLAAWLSRVTDQGRVAIGVPSHHRTTNDFSQTLGLFVELYPLRVNVEPGEAFSSLARKVAASTIDLLRHGVAGASASPGARGFPVVLNYITARFGDFGGLPTRADWIHAGYGDAGHVLRLQVHDFQNSGVRTLDFDLDQAVFGEVETGWAVRHFLALFDALADDPDQAIAEIGLVSWDDEAEFVPRGARVVQETGVLANFGRWLGQQPEAVAVQEHEQGLSYRALASRAAGVSEALNEVGVQAGDVVGVCMPRGAGLIASVLGALRSNVAFLPLDPTHPDERLAFQVRDAGVGFVLAPPSEGERITAWGCTPLDPFGSATDQRVGGPADWRDPEPETLAYVLYTSGSTGRPKGVEVTYGALSDYIGWAGRTYALEERLRWAWFTSAAYDLTMTSILTPLASGGSVVAYPDAPGEGGLLVRDVFTDNRVDVVKLTPSHLHLLRDLDLTRCTVRRLIVGGEDLRASIAGATYDAFDSKVEIFNEYGPTEATVACMVHRFDPSGDRSGSVPIGIPADNADIHVLGPGGLPTVRGEAGEICIAGPRVARGYRGRPELTEESFVEDPLDSSGRMYRTGDRGRWNAQGTLGYLGRDDDQVKVGGVRLELGEVQAALTEHPSVDAAVVQLVDADRHDRTARCRQCGLEASHPEARLDDSGVCAVCIEFQRHRDEVERYFGTLEDLEKLLAEARERSQGPHDCIMLYSGGKDSTYALCRIVELGANPLVFLLDNGYISDQAKDNVRRVTDLLGVDLVVGTTPSMPEIFAESLHRFSNVCQGCFKTVYTLALNLANERGISAIVTGLSRGQIFETRLADLYSRRIFDVDVVDHVIDEARRAYHGMDDAVAGLFDTGGKSVDELLDAVRFIDFYRYTDVELDEMLRYVGERTPWIRPSDTGRSTNCLINEAGIFVHKTERGFHNYALPYSWDVRLGHKVRDAAVAELEDDLDPANIRRMLDEVGYRERPSSAKLTRLVAYYTGTAEIQPSELRQFLGERLSPGTVPASFVHLETMPLTDHGKVDRQALPVPGVERQVTHVPFAEPTTETQRTLARVWSEVLGVERVGIDDDFFELGGESMRCIQIASMAREQGLAFSPRDLFRNPTVARLSEVATLVDPEDDLVAAEVSADELDDLAREFG